MKAGSSSRASNNLFIGGFPSSIRASPSRDSPYGCFEMGKAALSRVERCFRPGLVRARLPSGIPMVGLSFFWVLTNPFRFRRRVGLHTHRGRCDGEDGRGGPFCGARVEVECIAGSRRISWCSQRTQRLATAATTTFFGLPRRSMP